MNKLVTIIIPVYNTRQLLNKCIESICNQTYKNIEIIIIDDGSTDGSNVLCRELAAKDSRIKVIYQDNKGVSAARNKGLEFVSGDYITFVDGDDWIESNMIECLVKDAEANQVDAVFCSYSRNYENGKEINIVPRHVGIASPIDAIDELLDVYNKKAYPTGIFSKLFKKSIINLLRFNDTFKIGEDIAFVVEVLLKCNAVYLNNSPLYHYYIRNGSASHNSIIANKITEIYAWKYISNKLKEHPLQANRAKAIESGCYINAVLIAYINGDVRSNCLLREISSNFFLFFYKSDASKLSKCKKILLLFLIRLNVPANVIKKLERIKNKN